jgi:Na+-translocating ferredoxin:NAD+ oxidoreductase RNF subunit RnfB
VFAGGDVVAGERTVTAAAAWGLRAAWGIDVEIRGREIADRRPPPLPPSRDESWRSFADVLEAPKAARRVAPEAALTERRCGFAEVTAGLSEADARAEAARCLMCGLCGNCRACVDTLGCPALGMHDDQVAVTASLCIGCGVCADLCTNGALAPRGRS